MNTAPDLPQSAETPGPDARLPSAAQDRGNSITLLIPGQPFAKQRPRFSRASGRAYTPAATVSFERVVQQLAAIRIPAPLEGPLAVAIYATFVPPASWSKRKVEVTLHRPHIQRPDLDNIGKAILDGLNRIAWADDAQVADLHVRKVWGITPQTVVIISRIGPNNGF